MNAYEYSLKINGQATFYRNMVANKLTPDRAKVWEDHFTSENQAIASECGRTEAEVLADVMTRYRDVY